MSSSTVQKDEPPRMFWWLAATIALMLAARYFAEIHPAGLIAVSLYKCHLMSLGGWGGYWLDRALFPYARPHSYVADQVEPIQAPPADDSLHGFHPEQAATSVPAIESARDYPVAQLRRAVIVAACLVCVGLGA